MALIDIALILGISGGGFLSGFAFRGWLHGEFTDEPAPANRSTQYEPPRRSRDF